MPNVFGKRTQFKSLEVVRWFITKEQDNYFVLFFSFLLVVCVVPDLSCSLVTSLFRQVNHQTDAHHLSKCNYSLRKIWWIHMQITLFPSKIQTIPFYHKYRLSTGIYDDVLYSFFRLAKINW